MRISLVAALVAAVALGSACGGSNPGSGSGTLYVSARLETDGTRSRTQAWIEVKTTASGDVVNDASVTLKGDGQDALPITQLFSWGGAGPGVYVRNDFDWAPGFALEVKRGSDWLEAYIQTPGITNITQPTFDSVYSVAGGTPLLVKWEDELGRRADTVTIDFDTSPFTRQLNDDPLELAVESTNFQAQTTERVNVERWNSINLAGGQPGSAFSAITKRNVPFNVE